MIKSTLKVGALLAFLSATLLVTTVRADVFSSTGSKHPAQRTIGTPGNDFAKFEWLSDDGQPAVTVNRIVVSLAAQRLYAYHGEKLLAWSNVSSGRTGYETPTGEFNVTQKDVDHHSSLYDDASMPFFMRLTDSGVGLHAGFLPGYPASHGCIRLPFGMARELYERVDPGTPVEISPSFHHADVTRTAPTPGAVHLAQD